ncbi:hypothetical protein XENTR_v10017934 [Xenopus tropicalis]|uniref:Waprin-Phi1 n=1 Tax=Xenopus tropicalis TaxID=8364 RepID=A0A8J0QX97_XENTR|nr:waprin-Phi1 [Xenopus tropicalis]KAE8590083.1 hypothetical protein XENTR_v10017934 [Xenopus tropicalis]|eukprot:XP_002940796.2 PREDICTED: waprin-Phi1-like [Xenopus tropicalis]
MMLRVLIFSALLCLALARGSGEERGHSGENQSEIHIEDHSGKRGHCPVVPSGNNVTLAACNTTCPGGANCSNIECSSDTNCTGIQKCCNTSCGMACMNPEYKTPCVQDADCAGILICCRGRCVAPKPPKKGSREMTNKSRCD